MKLQKLGFTQQQLWDGALLGTIAHAVWVAGEPLLFAAQSWDGHNYLLNDSSGTIATVTFVDKKVVAVFFDANSSRNPFVTGDASEADNLIAGMPSDVLTILKFETLQYMLQSYKGQDVPLITAAMWSSGGDLVAMESWADLISHGGHIVRIQLLSEDEALLAWKEEFLFSEVQVNLVKSLYRRKIKNPDIHISLTDEEKLMLAPSAGETECREIFASLNVSF
ncbi:MAG: hypothetical protein WA123_03275 [Methylotenera sp.]